MHKKSTLVLLITCFISIVFVSQKSVAQESILGEVSSLYLEKLVAAAKANYPRVKSLGSEVNIAKSDLSAAKISWLDPFSFQYVTRSNDANVNSVNLTTADLLTGYQFGVNFNPGVLFAKPANIKRAKEQIKLAQANADEYLLQLEALVKTRYFLYMQYQKSLIPANNAYLDAESNVKSIKVKYQRGEASFLDYNSASIALNQSFQTKLETEANYLNAKVALEELTVVKLEYIK
ncbi:outer membrane protein TolC [Pedobacter sp. CAN_A7]|uniref:TolC family protein n=1 Tax=Pedobacter sp. CAN_A7 TaxID=2787722 RepID=UPI0018CBB349